VEHAVDRSRDVRVGRDVVLDELEPPLTHEVRDVLGIPRDEVVEADHRVSVSEEPVAEVRAEEAGGAGDEHSHARSLPRPNEK
jgi:hypothetical protein